MGGGGGGGESWSRGFSHSSITVYSIPLKQVTEVKFLGIYIDDKF